MPRKTFKDDPELGKRARQAAKGKPRPNRKSKTTLMNEAKKEIIKEELIRNGYLEEVQKNLPKVLKAHFKVAASPRASATQERKLLFEASGLKEKEKEGVGTTIGQVLAELGINK